MATDGDNNEPKVVYDSKSFLANAYKAHIVYSDEEATFSDETDFTPSDESKDDLLEVTEVARLPVFSMSQRFGNLITGQLSKLRQDEKFSFPAQKVLRDDETQTEMAEQETASTNSDNQVVDMADILQMQSTIRSFTDILTLVAKLSKTVSSGKDATGEISVNRTLLDEVRTKFAVLEKEISVQFGHKERTAGDSRNLREEVDSITNYIWSKNGDGASWNHRPSPTVSICRLSGFFKETKDTGWRQGKEILAGDIVNILSVVREMINDVTLQINTMTTNVGTEVSLDDLAEYFSALSRFVSDIDELSSTESHDRNGAKSNSVPSVGDASTTNTISDIGISGDVEDENMLRPVQSEADGQGPDQSEADGQAPDQSEADGQGPDQSEADGQGPDQLEADDQGPDQLEADGQRPDQLEADGQGPDQLEADDQGPDQLEADDQGPDQLEADGQGPDQLEADDQVPVQSEADGQRPDQSEADDQGPDQLEADDQVPVQSEADGQRPDQLEADGQGPDQSEADDQVPVQSEADGQRPDQSEADGQRPDQSEADDQVPVQSEADGQRPDQLEADDQVPVQSEADGQRPDQSETDGQRPDQSEADDQVPVQSEADGQRPDQSEADGQRPDQSEADDQVPVQSEADGQRPVQSEADGQGPNQSEADGQGPVQSEADGQGPVQSEADGQGPVQSEADEQGPNQSEADGQGPDQSEAEGQGPDQSEADGQVPVQSEADGQGPVQSAADGQGPDQSAADGQGPVQSEVDDGGKELETAPVCGRSSEESSDGNTLKSPGNKKEINSNSECNKTEKYQFSNSAGKKNGPDKRIKQESKQDEEQSRQSIESLLARPCRSDTCISTGKRGRLKSLISDGKDRQRNKDKRKSTELQSNQARGWPGLGKKLIQATCAVVSVAGLLGTLVEGPSGSPLLPALLEDMTRTMDLNYL